jgi:hypothetical protein
VRWLWFDVIVVLNKMSILKPTTVPRGREVTCKALSYYTFECALCFETDFCSGDQMPKSVAVPLASCPMGNDQVFNKSLVLLTSLDFHVLKP